MLDRRQQVAGFLKSGSWLRLKTTRLMSGLGLAAMSPGTADAARKGERRADFGRLCTSMDQPLNYVSELTTSPV